MKVILMTDITYRTARYEDCGKIAKLMDLASGGIIDFLYHDLFEDLEPAEFVERNLQSAQDPYNYNSAIVADMDGAVVGVCYSYPSSYHGLSDNSRLTLPVDRLACLNDFFNARIENSWYIDSFAVNPSMQGSGIGKRLLDMTIEKARKESFSTLTLMVFADNEKALRFYFKNNFEVAQKVCLDRQELIPHDGGCFLMQKDL
jgi:ribosomal protein S18 acetylase RimI-like enzyme